MKKLHLYLIGGIIVIILIAGAWYVFKYRECVKKVSYVPPREPELIRRTGNLLPTKGDKGDYYYFSSRKFKTSKEAFRTCIWE